MTSSMSRRAALAAGLLAAGPACAAETARVAIANFAFAPALLRIPRGTRVVWTNADDIPHVVVSAANPVLFRSPPLDTDDSFGFVFARAGDYDYFCALHPHMQGKVLVT